MTKVCYKCNKKFKGLPFKCKYCGQEFCDKHRLPEDHSCIGLEMRKQNIKERLAKGEKLSYEPKVRKEIKVKFEPETDKGLLTTPRDITAPLLKSPMAIIGIVVAVIVILLFIFAFLF